VGEAAAQKEVESGVLELAAGGDAGGHDRCEAASASAVGEAGEDLDELRDGHPLERQRFADGAAQAVVGDPGTGEVEEGARRGGDGDASVVASIPGIEEEGAVDPDAPVASGG